MFTVNTDGTLFWDNQTPFLSLTNLMFDHIVRRLRTSVDARLKAMADSGALRRLPGSDAGQAHQPRLGVQPSTCRY